MSFNGYKRRAPGSVHAVIAAGFAQAGGVEAAAARLPGRSAKRLYDAANPDADVRHAVQISYDEVRALTFGGVTAFAEDLAQGCGGAFLPPFDPAEGEIAALAAKLGQESGEALSVLFTRLADGVLCKADARAALPEVRDVMRAVTQLYQQLAVIADVGAPAGSPSSGGA